MGEGCKDKAWRGGGGVRGGGGSERQQGLEKEATGKGEEGARPMT